MQIQDRRRLENLCLMSPFQFLLKLKFLLLMKAVNPVVQEACKLGDDRQRSNLLTLVILIVEESCRIGAGKGEHVNALANTD